MQLVFWRKKLYNRTEVLAAADQARVRGQHRKAIKGYRKVLAVDPSDPVVHGKLAPLLARTRKRGEALASFQLAAQGHIKAGFLDRAIAVYVQAAGFFPEESTLWHDIARAEATLGRRADAVNALVKGSGYLGRRAALRPQAIQLLDSALKITPWHPDATLAMARLLAKQGDRAAGVALLEDLASRVRGPAFRRVRWALVRLAPTPGNAWRWVRSLFGKR
jgi:Tfp pilus assembly protein PilF